MTMTDLDDERLGYYDGICYEEFMVSAFRFVCPPSVIFTLPYSHFVLSFSLVRCDVVNV